jgi:hypothetical protein
MSKSKSKDKIQHLHGNLYRVHSSLIAYAEPHANIAFSNPRRTMVNGVLTGKGFTKTEMDELRSAIRTEGLHHPLMLRCVEMGKPMALLNGERRKRCIDKLKADKEVCLDPASGKDIPARDLYEYVECRILKDIDDKTAFKHAFSSNERAVDIGEGATVALIRSWRKQKWSDEDILGVTGKSITWLRDSDLLVKLDNKTFAALAANEINRTVAIKLAKIKDTNARQAALAKSREFAARRLKALQEKNNIDLAEAEKAAEVAEAQMELAEFKGKPVEVNRARKRHSRAKRKIDTTQTKRDALEQRNPQATIKDLNNAQEEIPKGLTPAKIRKHHIGDLPGIIAAANHEYIAGWMDYWWRYGVLGGERNIELLMERYERKHPKTFGRPIGLRGR